MTERPAPFIGATRVPWLRPVAQLLRVVALVVGSLAATDAGWTVWDVVVAAVLVLFLVWRSLPPSLGDTRLRDVMAAEVVVATLGVVVTGGWASPWLLAQLVPVGLATLGIPLSGAAALTLVVAVVDTLAALPFAVPGQDLASRVATLAIVAGFGALTRLVLADEQTPQDEALGQLEVLWSVRALLRGLHSEAVRSPVTFQLDEALATLRSTSAVLGAADVVALFALEADGTLRLLHGTGLPDRTFRVRELPDRAAAPRRDGEPVAAQLPAGGVTPDAVWGAYVWLPVAAEEVEHVLVVEHGGEDVTLDDALPELTRVARPLAVTVSNAAWFTRVSHLGVDEERQRIAARLHDQFAQSLAYVSMQLELALRRHPEDEALGELRAQVTDTLAGLRDTMVELRATVDEDHPLPAVLEALVERTQQRHGVVAELEVDRRGPRLPDGTAQQLLRTAQELVRRAVEDRGAFAVYVRYRLDEDVVQLTVSDDGEAPSTDEQRSIAEVVRDRAEAIGATVTTGRDGPGLSAVTISLQRTDLGARP